MKGDPGRYRNVAAYRGGYERTFGKSYPVGTGAEWSANFGFGSMVFFNFKAPSATPAVVVPAVGRNGSCIPMVEVDE